MKNRRMYSKALIAGALTVATMGSIGCGKKDEAASGDKASDKGEAKTETKAKPGAKGLSFEAGEIVIAGTTVKMDMPVGWASNKLGDDSVYMVSPNGSWLWVASTCNGSCSELEANVVGLAAAKTKEFEGASNTVELLKDEAVEGGHIVHLKLTKNDKELQYRDRVWLQEGWKSYISCAFVGKSPKDNESVEAIAKACDAATITYAKSE